MSQPIIPCPFCASTNNEIGSFQSDANDKHTEFAIYCNNCGAVGPNEISAGEAVKSWKMRRETFPQAVTQ